LFEESTAEIARNDVPLKLQKQCPVTACLKACGIFGSWLVYDDLTDVITGGEAARGLL